MSVPAFGWALERGAALKLLAADRLVLVYLADLANGARVCWPSQERIVEYTGLSLSTVRRSLHRLDRLQLIRVEGRTGCLPKYHILRDTPVNGNGVTPVNQHQVAPVNGKGVEAPTPVNQNHPPRSQGHPTPVKDAQTPVNQIPDPCTQVRDPRARAHAREGSEDFRSRHGKGTPPPAPTQVATPACGQQTEPETPPVTDEQMAAKLAGLAANVARRWQTNYPPRLSQLTRNEQADVVAGRSRYQAKPIPPDQLAAMRRVAQIRPVALAHA